MIKSGVYVTVKDLSTIYVCNCCGKYFKDKEKYLYHIRNTKINKIIDKK